MNRMDYRGSQRFFDFVGAIAAGLLLGFIFAWSRNSGDLNHPDSSRCFIFALGSFTVASLLLLGGGSAMVKIPKWILVAFLGSLLSFVSVVWFGDKPLEIQNPTFFDYLSKGFEERGVSSLLSVIFVDTPVALTAMAPIHYLPALGRVLGRFASTTTRSSP